MFQAEPPDSDQRNPLCNNRAKEPMRSCPSPYPSPNQQRSLARPGGVRLAYQDLGPRNTTPWLVLHGGPGSPSHAGLLCAFDLDTQRVIMADQRGAGRSRPHGHTHANQLSHLVADIEALREHLGVARWSVQGGSWGSTLALVYASTHPEQVERLVLRGPFDGSAVAVRRLFTRFGRGSKGHRAAARPQRFDRAQLFHLLQMFHFGTLHAAQRQALQQWARMERAALLSGMARSVWALPPGPDRNRARAGVRHLRRSLRSAACAGQPSHPTPIRDWLAMRQAYRIQAHYLAHRCFLSPGAWAAHAQAVARAQLPCHVVQGRYDQACAMQIAQHLASTLSAQTAWTHAGHLGSEVATERQLRLWVRPHTPP
jgi:proline iminopeptidase